ncbi:MAG: helix-turn-helix domain-containing protein [Candidatus Jordarchaeaceae archaeon]
MWELISYAHSPTRRLCLESLATGPKTPATIAKSSKRHLSHISRAIQELVKKGLVECMTPNLPKNRIYKITDKGIEVLKKLKEMNQKPENNTK